MLIYSIGQERFLKLANIIVDTFPHEQVATWYIPYKKNDSETQSARGTLTDCYLSRRKDLKLWGICKEGAKRSAQARKGKYSL